MHICLNNWIFIIFYAMFKYLQKMLENLTLTDCQEGLRSFVEKRKAQWKHE